MKTRIQWYACTTSGHATLTLTSPISLTSDIFVYHLLDLFSSNINSAIKVGNLLRFIYMYRNGFYDGHMEFFTLWN